MSSVASTKPACDGCARVVTSYRTADGSFRCQPCKATLPRSTCARCGVLMAHAPEVEITHCFKCVDRIPRIGSPCIRCGTVVDERGATYRGEDFCHAHRRHARAKKQCSYCGKQHTQVARSPTAGLDKPACPTCIAKNTPTCGVCRGKTRHHGTVQGIPACRTCVERGTLLTGLCSKCGKISRNPDSGHCSYCGFNRLARRSLEQLEMRLGNEWARELLRQFARDAGAEKSPVQVANLIQRNIDGFRLLDQSVPGPWQLTVTAVLEAFSSDTSHKRFRVVKNWLAASRDLDFDGPEAKWWCHNDWVQRRLNGERIDWIRAQLDAFMASLYAKREKYVEAGVRRAATPLAIKSLELALMYAQWFLKFCSERFGVTEVIGIQQRHLDAYAGERAKVYQTLGAFVRRLNATSHRMNRLTLHSKAPARSSQQNRLDASLRTKLIQTLMDSEGATDLRNASIALLAHFYVQRVSTVLNLKREALRNVEGEAMQIDFGRGFIEVDPAIAVVLRKWLAVWSAPSRFVTPENDGHLFPGIQPSRPYTAAAFGKWLRGKHRVYLRQLFSTGVHGLIEAGLRDPGMLVYGFGMSASTAIKYWRDSGRDVSSFLYEDAIELLRARGLLRGDG